jgi:hypothetical protein
MARMMISIPFGNTIVDESRSLVKHSSMFLGGAGSISSWEGIDDEYFEKM